jgi:signal transduction histidine kinase
MLRDDASGELRPPLAYRMTGGQWLAIDVATAVIGAVILTFGLRLMHAPHLRMPGILMAVVTLAATLPVAVRRIWPLPVLVVVAAAVAVLTAYARAPLGGDLMLGMASYLVAVRLPRPAAVAALVATEVAIGAGLLTAAATVHTQSVMLHSMLAAAAMWFVGDGVRERRKYRAGLEEQDRRQRAEEAERGSRAVAEERLRIARELHDVLAHTLSMVTVQAGVGRRVGASRPAEALNALRTVEESSRGALDELRRILCLIRGDEEPGVPGPGLGLAGAALVPAPGLADLDDLVAMVRSAGTPVTLRLTGEAAEVFPSAGLTAYRIVQEALTNVVRHAPGARATVRVAVGAAGIRIRVTDNGATGQPGRAASPAPPAGTHGIVGMRERAAAFGGTLSAGAMPGGGFEVAAFLPAPGHGAQRAA